MATFSERLKKLREEHGHTQKGISEKMNFKSPSTIGMYERGERQPDQETIIKLASFFNVSTDYLLGKSDTNDIRNYEYIKKRLNSPLASSLLDEEFIKKLAITKRISEDEAEKLMEQVLIDSSIKFFDFSFDDWALVDRIKEEMLSNDKPVEENIAKGTFKIIIEIFDGLSKHDLISVLGIFKDIKDRYPNILSEVNNPKEEAVVNSILEFYPDDKNSYQKVDRNEINSFDTIAAHLKGKILTPKKLKLIEQYIDALFEDDEGDY